MKQETGETRDAIINDDNKHIEAIIAENKHLKNLYWIVVFATPSKQIIKVDGKLAHGLMKHIKAYNVKPASQVGMLIGEVDNTKGTISWEINMPQKPFDYDALKKLGAKASDEVIIETTTIPGAYITK